MTEESRPAMLDNPQFKQRNDNSNASQRARILDHFDHCIGLSTMEALNDLGILHLSKRIRELRKHGHDIAMFWTYQLDANGVNRRVAMYVYRDGGRL